MNWLSYLNKKEEVRLFVKAADLINDLIWLHCYEISKEGQFGMKIIKGSEYKEKYFSREIESECQINMNSGEKKQKNMT